MKPIELYCPADKTDEKDNLYFGYGASTPGTACTSICIGCYDGSEESDLNGTWKRLKAESGMKIVKIRIEVIEEDVKWI